jgi:hypothetical protein
LARCGSPAPTALWPRYQSREWPPEQAQPIRPPVCGCQRHWLRSSGCRSARCGHLSSAIVVALARMPRSPGSSAPAVMITPTRRIRSGCCACAASGHATAEPPTNEMKSRRFMCPQIEGPNLQYRRGAETALCNTAKSGGRGPVRVKTRIPRFGAYVSSHRLRTWPHDSLPPERGVMEYRPAFTPA